MIAPVKGSKKIQVATQPEFVQRGLRALRRATRKLRAEHRRLGLPLIGWKDGKVQKVVP